MRKLTLAVLISLMGLSGGVQADSPGRNPSGDTSTVDPTSVVKTPAGRKALGPQVGAVRPDSSGSSDSSGAAGPGTIIAIPGHAYDPIRDSTVETPAGELVGPAPDAQALGLGANMDLYRSGNTSIGR